MESDLNTVIAHLTHIGEEAGVGERRDRNLIGVEQVLGRGHIGVDGTAEPAAPHREVDTCVEGVLGLPLQVRIRVGIESVGGDGRAVVGRGAVRGHERKRPVRIDGILITGDTVTDADLKVVEQLLVLHETFIADDPCHGS